MILVTDANKSRNTSTYWRRSEVIFRMRKLYAPLYHDPIPILPVFLLRRLKAEIKDRLLLTI